MLDAHQLSTYPLLVEASGLTALVSVRLSGASLAKPLLRLRVKHEAHPTSAQTPGLSHLVPVEEAFSVFFTSNNVSFSPSSVTSPGFCCAAKGALRHVG